MSRRLPGRRLPRGLAVLAATAAAAALAGCGEPPLTAEEARAQGRDAVDRAIALFQEGEILASYRELQRAEAIAAEFAATAEPQDDAPTAAIGVPSGPTGGWVAEWREDYRDAVESSWPVVREAVREETIDLSLLKGIVSDVLGSDQVERVNREYRAAEPMLKARRASQYWLDCQGHPEGCSLLDRVLRERMGARTVTTSWTGFREDYLGVVEARIEVLESVDYRAGGTASAGGFPKTLSVRFDVRRGDGGSDRWTRPFGATLEGDPPTRIERGEYPEVHRRHFEELEASLREQLARWPDAGPATP